MRTLAILPMKDFGRAKQRLSERLPAGTRRALAEAMFADVLTALRRCAGIEEVVVVGDDAAQALAEGYDARVIPDPAQEGQSEAALLGIDYARRAGAERVLLVPGDCPALDPAEVDALLGRPRADGGPLAIAVPDRHGSGTNALLLTPPDAMRPAFGPDSLARHRAVAESAGAAFEVAELPSLGLDVDTGEDLEQLLAELERRRGGAARTRGTLSQLVRTVGLDPA